MARITFDGKDFKSLPGESALDTLIRCGQEVSYSCKSGVCQSCVCRIEKGDVSPSSQLYLSPHQVKMGHFLPCSHIVSKDISFSSLDCTYLNMKATLIEKHFFTQTILKIVIEIHENFEWLAGQYITITFPNGVMRCYSIANVPNDDNYIECHIRLISNGRATQWLFNDAKIGDELFVRGAYGHCFYDEKDGINFDLLLVGMGIGVAPLYGIAQTALNSGHKGDITLVHCAREAEDAYLSDAMKVLSDHFSSFRYIISLKNNVSEKGVCHFEEDKSINYLGGDIVSHLSTLLSSPKMTSLYVCGNDAFVKKVKNTAFLKGVASDHIFGDIFLSQSMVT